jgi:hypothetical protein
LNQSAPANPKSRNMARSLLRVTLAVVALAAIVAVGTVASVWTKLQRAGASSLRSNIELLRASALQLRFDGFNGCPTVQQVLDLTREPAKSELQRETNGVDTWGTPLQLECDADQVRVFSAGPDKQARTADDIVSRY